MYKLLSIFFTIIFLSTSIINSQEFNYDIKYHRLELRVDPAEKFINGKVTTYFSPTIDSLNQISFDLIDQLIVDSIFFKNKKVNFFHENDILTANLNTELKNSDLDSISIFYHGVPGHSGFGSFIVSSHNRTPILWTLSEPYGAKTWWPCKEILNDKADSVEMIVTTPKQYKVAGNGLLVSEKLFQDSLKITHWKHNYPITAYLIAFSVTNYSEYYDYVQVNDSVTIQILEYVYPEDSAYIRNKSSDIIDVFKFYCDTFLMYPFVDEKYGQAQFGWGGGMEHQTMTFLGNFEHSLMAHELAHQWFGNYITCGSWHDIWLNEGFAVYLEGLTCEQGLAPKSWDRWKANTMYQATYYSSGSVYVEDTTSVSRIFNYNLTYMKGGMILHLLRWQIGDKAFFDGIRNYLRDPQLAYSYATVDDLKKHFENTCDCDLTYFFEDWYYGEGYPTYNIEWRQTNDKKIHIKINQNHSAGNINFFELKLPLKIQSNFGDTLIILDNKIQNETFIIDDFAFKVSNIIFDPDKWILTRNSIVTQIIQNFAETEVKVSPNPAKNRLLIEFPIETTVKEYQIYDTLGKEYFTENISKRTNHLNINIKKLNKGNYILYIKTSDGNISKHFIKE